MTVSKLSVWRGFCRVSAGLDVTKSKQTLINVNVRDIENDIRAGLLCQCRQQLGRAGQDELVEHIDLTMRCHKR